MRRGLLILAAGLVMLTPVTGQQATEQGLKDRSTIKERAALMGHDGPVRSVIFSPDGRTLSSISEDRTIKLWDVATGKERATLKGHGGFVFSVAYSPDGRTLASCSEDKTIKLWEVATGKERGTLKGHAEAVSCVAFSPDGRTLASGSFCQHHPVMEY